MFETFSNIFKKTFFLKKKIVLKSQQEYLQVHGKLEKKNFDIFFFSKIILTLKKKFLKSQQGCLQVHCKFKEKKCRQKKNRKFFKHILKKFCFSLKLFFHLKIV